MRRRLLLLVVVSDLLVLIVLAISILPLTSSKVLEDQEARMRGQILTVVAFLFENSPTPEETAVFLQTVDIHEGSRLGVLGPDGVVGRDAARFDHIVDRTPPPGLRVSNVAKLYPLFFTEPNGDRIGTQAVTNTSSSWIVEGTITAGLLRSEEVARWLRISFYYLLAFGLSLLVADVISRRLVRPLQRAVVAADAIGRSELRADVPTSGPAEVVALGKSLQSLGGRIERLVDSERERAAHLSHSLRTPLTVIALEVQRLQATTTLDLGNLQHGIDDLERSLDDVIQQSRQTRIDGLDLHCDAATVLRRHLDYWGKLAALQQRIVDEDLAPGSFPVGLSEQDLGLVLDALLSNVFRHTGTGTGYAISLRARDGKVELSLSNSGSPTDSRNLGSSGIGLRVARGAVESAGGTFTATSTPGDGLHVLLTLPLIAPPPGGAPKRIVDSAGHTASR